MENVNQKVKSLKCADVGQQATKAKNFNVSEKLHVFCFTSVFTFTLIM